MDIDEIQPIDKIANIEIPILIIGGENDSRTKLEDTQALFNAARQPKEVWISPGAEHENIFEKNPDEYKSKVLTFLQKYL
ncbi:MAG: alpha/beta hydrolase [Ignavibacteria bacterium]